MGVGAVMPALACDAAYCGRLHLAAAATVVSRVTKITSRLQISPMLVAISVILSGCAVIDADSTTCGGEVSHEHARRAAATAIDIDQTAGPDGGG